MKGTLAKALTMPKAPTNVGRTGPTGFAPSMTTQAPKKHSTSTAGGHVVIPSNTTKVGGKG